MSDLPTALSETSAKIHLRSKAKNAFVTNKRDVGIVGVSLARGGGGGTACATAGECKEITGLLEVRESDFSKRLVLPSRLRLLVRLKGISDCVR